MRKAKTKISETKMNQTETCIESTSPKERFVIDVVYLCWLWSFASAFSSFCSFFYSISTFLSDRSGSIRSRFELLQFEIEPFQFSKAWRMGTEPVPFGTTKFQIQTRSVLVMDEVLHAQLKMDGDEAERRSPSSITNIRDFVSTTHKYLITMVNNFTK